MVMDGRRMWVLLLGPLTSRGEPAHTAKVSDAHVALVGSKGGGIVNQPHPVDGAPLAAVLRPESRCIPAENLLAMLGPACSHETENPGQPTQGDVDDLEGGKPKRLPEVRWYCGDKMDVRVVFDPCVQNGVEGLTPVEIAVATHRP